MIKIVLGALFLIMIYFFLFSMMGEFREDELNIVCTSYEPLAYCDCLGQQINFIILVCITLIAISMAVYAYYKYRRERNE